MEKGLKIGESLEGDVAIPEFDKKESEPEEMDEVSEKIELDDESRYLKESFNRHWSEIIQDHIDEFPEEDRSLLDKVFENLREGKNPTAYLGKKKQRFFDARSRLWQKIFGIKFVQWDGMRQSLKDKNKNNQNKLGNGLDSQAKEQEVAEVAGVKKNEDEPVEISPEQEKTWFEIMLDARNEFPEDIRILIDKKRGHSLEPEEQSRFDTAKNEWWKQKFGIEFWNRKGSDAKKQVEKRERKISKREGYLNQLQADKIKRMEQLHHVFKNLDEGEPIDEFRDETRRVIYYDEESDKYFIDDNGQKKYLGKGDILSDYAWGIRYVPDGDMIEPAYRNIAKKILTNEVRRDLEDIYDIQLELKHQNTGYTVHRSSDPISIIERWPKLDKQGKIADGGMIAENMVRELATRVSINNDMNFYVARATALEDSVFKYDFKVRASRNRGVEVGNGEEVAGKIKKLGIQFTTRIDGPASNRKGRFLEEVKKRFNNELPVDDLMYLRVPTGEFRNAFDRWLKNKPSGGPEQFLSRDLKIKLLKEVTKELIEISDEDIERIFPEPN